MSPEAAVQLQQEINMLQLPPHVHAQVLAGRDPNGIHVQYVAVWGDRPYTVCPRCGQPVKAEVECPLMLDSGHPGGRLMEWDQTHGCGHWLSVPSMELDDPDSDDVTQAATEVAADRDKAIDADRQRIEGRLARDLTWLQRCLVDPLADGETPSDRINELTRGIRQPWQQVEPGLYLDPDEGAFVAWDFDPDGSGDVIQQRLDHVTYAQAAAMLGVHRSRVGHLVQEGRLDRAPEGGVTVASVLTRSALLDEEEV